MAQYYATICHRTIPASRYKHSVMYISASHDPSGFVGTLRLGLVGTTNQANKMPWRLRRSVKLNETDAELLEEEPSDCEGTIIKKIYCS